MEPAEAHPLVSPAEAGVQVARIHPTFHSQSVTYAHAHPRPGPVEPEEPGFLVSRKRFFASPKLSHPMTQATLGGGCFWCLEAVFDEVNGVTDVVSGYAGGHVPNPSYEAVCSGRTGHAEVVQITFDPDVISFRDLLYIFFAIHDPTTPNRQGADVGTQYRSAIFTHDESQQDEAESVAAELEASGAWGAPVVTEITTLDRFWPAEDYHQEYFARNPNQGYCRVVVAPKLAKFRTAFGSKRKHPGS